MRVVFRMSAIVAALAVATSVALTGCGQRGPLYLPSIPPLPEKPTLRSTPSASDTSDTSAPAQAVSDAQAPLTLAPAGSLGAASGVKRPTSAAGSASSPAPDQ